MDLPWHLELDVAGRYVDSIRGPNIPSYFSLDVRLGWRPNPHLELSVVGQNLLDDRHPEFNSTIVNIQNTQVQRGVYGKITWRF